MLAGRWWSATWNPQDFESMASKVQDLVVGVRTQCEELLTWNVNVIRRQNEGKQIHTEGI